MAAERKRIMGEIAAWQVCELAKRINGEQLNPVELNPYQPPVQLPVDVMEAVTEQRKKQLAANLKLMLFGLGTG